MFEALIITLREGVEAALVLALATTILRRENAGRRVGALYAGAGVALLASVALAVLAARLTYNQELAEGVAMLVGFALVLTLVYWMWKSAPRMREEIQSGLARAADAGGAGLAATFLFGFGMVLREGFETAVFLRAAEFSTQGLMLWVGALIGLTLAAVIGVLFARGTLQIPLKQFFQLTSVVLVLFAFQLLVGGLHELSEAEVLPASRTSMALIGPIVKNELLLFTLTLAVALGWLLTGGARQGAAAPARGMAAERLERATQMRQTSRLRWTGVLGLLVVATLAVGFVRTSRVPPKPPAESLTIAEGLVSWPEAALADRAPHFYEVALDGRPVRFFAIQVDGSPKTCFDACEICGDIGYFGDHGALVCRNCTSPIPIATLGRSGGCNPIPLPNERREGRVIVREADLRAGLPDLGGR